MDFSIKDKAVVLFEDGSYYEGSSAGMKGTAYGEVCFNTGMTGYQEIFTDPSYYGQVLVTTNAHIGNYGTKVTDTESARIQIAGLICKNFTNEYSRLLADQDIQQYFEDNKIVCIYDVDTRAIVRNIRHKGAMNCIISSEVFDRDELTILLKKFRLWMDLSWLVLCLQKLIMNWEIRMHKLKWQFWISVQNEISYNV